MSTTVWIIIAGAVLTFLTRIGGHVVLSRLTHIPPRVEAALNAVPAAVLTALTAPYVAFGGPIEAMVLAIAAVLSLRLPVIATLFVGWALLMALRQII